MQAANLTAGAVGADGAVARFAHAVVAGGSAFYRAFRQIPDMVNGQVDNFNFIFVSEGLTLPWRWVPDVWLATLPQGAAEVQVALRVAVEATYHSIMLTRSGVDAAKARLMAVTLAAGRVAIRRAWGVVTADIVPTQLMSVTGANDAAMTVDADGALAGDVAGFATAAEFTAELGEVTNVFAAGADDLFAHVAQGAIGMPACNGVIITLTLVHHYVDPHKNVCDAVVRQVMGATPTLPDAITLDEIKDVMCHKTAHPIESPKLIGLARSPQVKTRLMAIGLGSASVRLPAMFSPERTATSIAAMVSKAAQAVAPANVTLNVAEVEAHVDRVRAALAANANVRGIRDAEALNEAFKRRWSGDIAWCAGYLGAMFDETRASARARSVVEAWSVKGIATENEHFVAMGRDHHEMAARWRKARAREGHLPGFGLFGAAAPRAWMDPEREARVARAAGRAARRRSSDSSESSN